MEVDSQTEMTQRLPEHVELHSLSLQGGRGFLGNEPRRAVTDRTVEQAQRTLSTRREA